MFQMDKLRRLSQGRLSEIFGEGAINVDKAMRNFGFEHLAKLTYQNLDEKSKRILKDYTDGVNDYLEYFSSGIDYWLLGAEFEPWKPEDSLSVYIYTMYSLSHSKELYRDYLFSKIQDEEIVDLMLPSYPEDEIEFAQSVITDEELKENKFYKKDGLKRQKSKEKRKIYEFISNNLEEELKLVEEIRNLFSPGQGASNCWAISGEYTKNGKPILVNDPHLDPSIPSPFYMAELNVNDQFIVGALIPGAPLFVSARTNYISYGVTSLNADIIDYFEEKIKGNEYLFKDKWHKLEVREEVINVKDGKPETIIVRSTHHGPILDHAGSILNAIDPSRPPLKAKADVSFAWTGYNFDNHLFNVMMDLFEIKDVQTAIKHLKGKNGATYGMCLADTHGNIGYIPITTYPKRKDEYKAGSGIKEGWTGENEWDGFVDAEKIPYLLNPKKGFVFTANGRVSSPNVEAGVAALHPSTARAARINYLLNDILHVKKQKVDKEDMKKILNDTYDMFAAVKTPLMIEIVEKNSALEKYITDKQVLKQITEWLKTLKSWNYEFGEDMSEPTIFTLWEIHFVYSLFKAQIDNEYLRAFASVEYGYDDFLVKLYRKLAKDPSHFSKYCIAADEKSSEGCTKALVEGLQFVYDYLVPEGTTLKEEDSLYKNWHRVIYRYPPFTKTFLRYFFDRSDSDSGSKHTINVGSIYYAEFKLRGLESMHTPNYRMIVDFGKDEDNLFSTETGVSENLIGHYFYYNQHTAHKSLEMLPMGFNSINTTQTHRFCTLRLIYKSWFDEEEERLRLLEEAKNSQGNKAGAKDKEDL